MITSYLSKKINHLSFLLIIMVVGIHSFNIHNRINGYTNSSLLNELIQAFISNGICRIAVPLFYIFSGFFFFYDSGNSFTFTSYKTKIKKRISSLVIPYLLVSSIGLFSFWLFQNIPFTKPFFYNNIIEDLSSLQLVNTWLINPLPYQLWFIRNLLVICLLSPVIYFSIKRFGVFFLLSTFISWLFIEKSYYYMFDTLFPFTLGAYVALNNTNLKIETDKRFVLLIGSLWFILTAISVYYNSLQHNFNVFLSRLSLIIGVLALWQIYDYAYKNLKRKYFNTSIVKFSFFIFLFHEPILTLVIKLMFSILGNSDLTSLITYFIAPIITISLCLVCSTSLKLFMPKSYHLIVGNR